MNNLKISVLVDNNSIIDRYFLSEPGLSFYLETDKKKILFDTGYSDVFIKNAQKMGINLLDINYLVLSHGHLDHTWGLEHFGRLITESYFENQNTTQIELLTHPLALNSRYFDGNLIGTHLSLDYLESIFKISCTTDVRQLTENLYYLGEIPRKFEFENNEPIGLIEINEKKEKDYLLDDTALVYKGKKGLVIITGCSHAGICNIIDYAKKITKMNKINAIIGGFHLQNETDEKMNKIKDYIELQDVNIIYPSHCTDLKSKIVLSSVSKIAQVGSGLTLEFK